MTANCIAEPGVFVYSNPDSPTEGEKVFVPPNTCVELYFDLSSIIAETILTRLLSLPEMSDKELIEAADKTGTFEFWNNEQDDVYNKML